MPVVCISQLHKMMQGAKMPPGRYPPIEEPPPVPTLDDLIADAVRRHKLMQYWKRLENVRRERGFVFNEPIVRGELRIALPNDFAVRHADVPQEPQSHEQFAKPADREAKSIADRIIGGEFSLLGRSTIRKALDQADAPKGDPRDNAVGRISKGLSR